MSVQVDVGTQNTFFRYQYKTKIEVFCLHIFFVSVQEKCKPIKHVLVPRSDMLIRYLLLRFFLDNQLKLDTKMMHLGVGYMYRNKIRSGISVIRGRNDSRETLASACHNMQKCRGQRMRHGATITGVLE